MALPKPSAEDEDYDEQQARKWLASAKKRRENWPKACRALAREGGGCIIVDGAAGSSEQGPYLRGFLAERGLHG